MIAPLSLPTIAVLPDTTSAPVRSEAPSPQVPQPSQPDRVAQATANQAGKQDSVTLSSTALDMSKTLNQQHEQKVDLQQEAAKQQEQPVSEERKPYTAAGKSYPPFIGNSEELKSLKESSPALYREILKMIVPPPLNISYSDMQLLQSGKVDVTS
jgi:hypothetical protein